MLSCMLNIESPRGMLALQFDPNRPNEITYIGGSPEFLTWLKDTIEQAETIPGLRARILELESSK